MNEEIRCPSCGEEDELQGTRSRPAGDKSSPEGDAEVIHICCETCGAEWDRSLEKLCPRCGAGDLYPVPVAIVEKSRGSQLSILTTQPKYFCWVCDRDIIDAQRQSGIALMPDELPTLSTQDRPESDTASEGKGS